MPGLHNTVTIAAPPQRVWSVVVDVERWPERIPTVDAVERLDAGPLAVCSRTRLQQPGCPRTAVWTVTELADGSSYTWESSLLGITVTAAHVVEPHPEGSRLTLALNVSGPLSGIAVLALPPTELGQRWSSTLVISGGHLGREWDVRVEGRGLRSVSPGGPQNAKPYLGATSSSTCDAYQRAQFDPRGRS